jgi:hypothetical protein
MSRDIVDIGFSLRLVVAAGVEGELADELTGVVEDSDVSSGDEHGDGLVGVASPDADVVETAGWKKPTAASRSLIVGKG